MAFGLDDCGTAIGWWHKPRGYKIWSFRDAAYPRDSKRLRDSERRDAAYLRDSKRLRDRER